MKKFKNHLKLGHILTALVMAIVYIFGFIALLHLSKTSILAEAVFYLYLFGLGALIGMVYTLLKLEE